MNFLGELAVGNLFEQHGSARVALAVGAPAENIETAFLDHDAQIGRLGAGKLDVDEHRRPVGAQEDVGVGFEAARPSPARELGERYVELGEEVVVHISTLWDTLLAGRVAAPGLAPPAASIPRAGIRATGSPDSPCERRVTLATRGDIVTAAATWPKRLARTLPIPGTNLARNLETSAERYPDKTAIVYYDSAITYGALWRDVEALAGWLQARGVAKGDRVILDMQNSPHFVVAFYAVLRANAVVVPLNPMYVSDELGTFIDDAGAHVALVGAELFERIAPHVGTRLQHVVTASYGEALDLPTDLALPPGVGGPVPHPRAPGVTAWPDVLASREPVGPYEAAAEDLAVMPYTSGTTGKSKGCAHTHRSVQAVPWAGIAWGHLTAGATALSVLPYFHVTGMQMDMNVALAVGATLVVMTRWDAPTALALVRRYGVTHWTAIATMVVDLVSRPDVDAAALASVRHISGGGAALPGAVSDRLFAMTGLRYIEGYGLSETISMTHANPAGAEKPQCLGIPTFDVDSRVIDPQTLREVAPGETGEIIIAGPQIMREYWGQPQATAEAFIERDGKRFLRTGDLGYVDPEGYFFMVDRLKRMINASGFKVWPAEVETQLFAHPAIREACVIATIDPRRGETTKALVVLRDGATATGAEIAAWARERMAAYKVPAVIEFVAALPRSGSGKVQWRLLQEEELRRAVSSPAVV